MKKLAIYLALSLSALASQYSIVTSINTTHLKYGYDHNQYEFNEDNNLIGFEVQNGKSQYSIATFENSFFNRSYSINYQRDIYSYKKLHLNLGLSLIHGYNEEDTLKSKTEPNVVYVFQNKTYIGSGLTLSPTLSIEYKFSPHLSTEIDILGNAFVTTVVYTW